VVNWKSLLALTLAGALIFGACGGDDDDSGDNGSKDEATQPANSDATKTSSEPTKASGDATKPSGDATKPAANPTTEDAGSIFDRLATEGEAKTYQASYDFEFRGGDTGGMQKGSAIIASKPPKYATKLTFSVGDMKSSFTIIVDGKDTITCTDFGVGGQCHKSAGVDDGLNGRGIDIKKALNEAKKNADVKDAGKRTIAGQSSRCFEAKDKTTSDVTTFCIAEKDSIMTYMEVSGSVKMTATEISSRVDEKLFEPPFPVN